MGGTSVGGTEVFVGGTGVFVGTNRVRVAVGRKTSGVAVGVSVDKFGSRVPRGVNVGWNVAVGVSV